ncbi:prepilin peptidase [Rhodophyticola sp. SM2404]
MNITFQEAAWFLPFVLPICLYVSWTDLRDMRITNYSVLALFAVFAVGGLFLLPLEVYGWRMLALALVLVAGFVITSLGMVGAGDAKFAAAMAPFVAQGDGLFFVTLFAMVLIGSWITHRSAGRIPAVRRATPDWVSWERGKLFPMGVALSGALVIYLVMGLGLWA